MLVLMKISIGKGGHRYHSSLRPDPDRLHSITVFQQVKWPFYVLTQVVYLCHPVNLGRDLPKDARIRCYLTLLMAGWVVDAFIRAGVAFEFMVARYEMGKGLAWRG